MQLERKLNDEASQFGEKHTHYAAAKKKKQGKKKRERLNIFL
jgi:hypothetical protein